MRSKFLAFLTLLLPFGCLTAGCVTDAGKQLVHQTGGAGKILEGNPDPTVASMGRDVRMNSEAVEAEIGSPKNPQPYSPAASQAARTAQTTTLEARKGLADFIWQIATAGASAIGLGAVVGWFRSALTAGKLLTFADTVGSVVEKGGELLKNQVASAAKDRGVADTVHQVVEMLKK